MASVLHASIAQSIVFGVAVLSAQLAFTHFRQVLVQWSEESTSDLQAALDHMLLGDSRREARLVTILAGTQDQYNALPKNSRGRLGTRAVRHLVHSYLVGERGWILRGLEYHGMRRASSKALHEVGLVQHQAPQIRRALLDAKQSEKGLALKEVVGFIAALEQLLLADFVGLLESTYKLNGHNTSVRLSTDQMLSVVVSFVILFRGGFDEKETEVTHVYKKAAIVNDQETWASISKFLNQVFEIVLDERWGKHVVGNRFRAGKFSFDDVWALVQVVTERYGHWQNTECEEMTEILSSMDHGKSGRIALRDFWRYNTSMKFSFVESPAYLRDIGALDESLPKDPKLIISNYVLGPNNCIALFRHYSFCCINKCASLTARIERRVGAPSATPDTLWDVVRGNLSASFTPRRQLPWELEGKLHEVAARHGGRVPLYGRLFAQWMHFAFPLECPYPQVIERNGALNPEYGKVNTSYVSEEDKKAAFETADASIQQPFLAQWSDEEVLPLEDEPVPVGSALFESCVYSGLQFVILAAMARLALSSAGPRTVEFLRCSSGAVTAMILKKAPADKEKESQPDLDSDKSTTRRKQSGQKEGKKRPKQLPSQRPAPPPQPTASASETKANAPQPTSSRAARGRRVAGEKQAAVPLSPAPMPPVPALVCEVAAEADAESERLAASGKAVGVDTTDFAKKRPKQLPPQRRAPSPLPPAASASETKANAPQPTSSRARSRRSTGARALPDATIEAAASVPALAGEAAPGADAELEMVSALAEAVEVDTTDSAKRKPKRLPPQQRASAPPTAASQTEAKANNLPQPTRSRAARSRGDAGEKSPPAVAVHAAAPVSPTSGPPVPALAGETAAEVAAAEAVEADTSSHNELEDVVQVRTSCGSSDEDSEEPMEEPMPRQKVRNAQPTSPVLSPVTVAAPEDAAATVPGSPPPELPVPASAGEAVAKADAELERVAAIAEAVEADTTDSAKKKPKRLPLQQHACSPPAAASQTGAKADAAFEQHVAIAEAVEAAATKGEAYDESEDAWQGATPCGPLANDREEPMPKQEAVVAKPPSPTLSPVKVAAPEDAEVPRPSKFLQAPAVVVAPASFLQPVHDAAKDGHEDVAASPEPHRILRKLLSPGEQAQPESVPATKASKPTALATMLWLDPAGKAKETNKLQSKEGRQQRSKSVTFSREVREVRPSSGLSEACAQSAWTTDELDDLCNEALSAIFPYGCQDAGQSDQVQVQVPICGGVEPSEVAGSHAMYEQKFPPWLQPHQPARGCQVAGQSEQVAGSKAMYEQKFAPSLQPHQPARGTQPRQRSNAFKIVNPRTLEVITSAEVSRGSGADEGGSRGIGKFKRSAGAHELPEGVEFVKVSKGSGADGGCGRGTGELKRSAGVHEPPEAQAHWDAQAQAPWDAQARARAGALAMKIQQDRLQAMHSWEAEGLSKPWEASGTGGGK